MAPCFVVLRPFASNTHFFPDADVGFSQPAFAQALWIIVRQWKRTTRLAPISPFFAFFSTGEMESIKTARRRRIPGIVGITLLARPGRMTRDRLLNR
jgi:hypothetical protein